MIISSILPRVDGAVQLKVDTVNKATRDMCLKDPSIDYVCNDGCFKLANQTQNRSLFVSNGLHPSYSGTTNLLRNLGLLDVTVVKRWNPRNNQVQPNEMYMIPPQPHFPGYPPPPQSNAWINRGPQRMGTSYQGNGARPAVRGGPFETWGGLWFLLRDQTFFFDSQLKRTIFFSHYQKQTIFFLSGKTQNNFFSPFISFDSLYTMLSSRDVTTFT